MEFNFYFMERKILHIDMNSYFATVEQQANPYLRGKPIGVKGSEAKRTIVAAASIEAKKYGVKTGMRVDEALEICPELILVVGEPIKYSSVTKKFIEIFERYTDKVEIFSIDEAFLDVTKTAHLFSRDCYCHSGIAPRNGQYPESRKVLGLDSRCGGNDKRLDSSQARMTTEGVVEIAKRIKADIRLEIGEWVTCSVGVGSNKFLAKLGSDMEKPDGLVIFNDDNTDELLLSCKLTDFCGIANRIERRLNQMGVYTVADLREADDLALRKEFGVYGLKLKNMAWGRDSAEVLDWHDQADAKSFGHSRTLNKDVVKRSDLSGQLYLLSEKVAKRMRDEKYFGKEIGLWIRFNDFAGMGKRRKIGYWTNDGYEIYKEACKLLDEIYFGNQRLKFQNPNDKFQIKSKCSNLKIQTTKSAILATKGGQNHKAAKSELDSGQARMTIKGRFFSKRKPVRAMGVYVTRLTRVGPLSLFEEDRKNEKILKTMDNINNRFGENTLFKGALLKFPFKRIVSGLGRKKF